MLLLYDFVLPDVLPAHHCDPASFKIYSASTRKLSVTFPDKREDNTYSMFWSAGQKTDIPAQIKADFRPEDSDLHVPVPSLYHTKYL